MLPPEILEFAENHYHPIFVLEKASLKLVFGNFQARQILGFTQLEIKNMELADLGENDGADMRQLLNAIKNDDIVEHTVRCQPKSGDLITFTFHGFVQIPNTAYRIAWLKPSGSLETYISHHDELVATYHNRVDELRRTNMDRDYTMVKMELAYQAMEVEVEKRKVAEEQLRLLALTDPLTGIGNRRYFDDNFVREWRRAVREKEQLSVIMLDIDYFKSYNDIYGHQNGDSCLKRVSELIASKVKRPDDFIARVGGEEFAIILPNTNHQGANHIAESIRASVDRACLTHKGSHVTDHVTVSLGFATCLPSENESADAFLKRADLALYEAKSAGRNRISSFVAA